MSTQTGLFRGAPGPRRSRWLVATALLAVFVATAAGADQLSVRIQTDKGNEAVYQSGDPIHITIDTNQDANLLVYEIDAVGAVNLLFPTEDGFTNVKAGRIDLPRDAEDELVVEGPVGEGYIVAIASDGPFVDLPWYMRPHNAQGDALGYTEQSDTVGVTPEGTIVGDPFVAMERIRRQVLKDPNDTHSFATAYTTYYLHEQVNYPRYLCNDCHREEYYSWWDGFDPYYTTCSAFEFRVNASWWWGPSYWCGYVPYFAYVYRPTCPPAYLPGGGAPRPVYSSWDGWSRWNRLWNGPLHRIKSTPPAGYVGPGDWKGTWTARGGETPLPPGYMASAHRRWGGDTSGGTIRPVTRDGLPTPGSVAGDVGRARASGGNNGWGRGEQRWLTPPGAGSNGGDRANGNTGWNRGGMRWVTPPESGRTNGRPDWANRGNSGGSDGGQRSGTRPSWIRTHWGDGTGRWQQRGGGGGSASPGMESRLPGRQQDAPPAQGNNTWGGGQRGRMRAPEAGNRPSPSIAPRQGNSWSSPGGFQGFGATRGFGSPMRSGRP